MPTVRNAVLAIGAHPDDIEFMMAGTLFLLRGLGWETHYLNLCDGCCGTKTDDVAAIRAKRKAEAQEACRMLGATYYASLAHDLELYHTTETVSRVVAVVRRAQPGILLLHSPSDYMEDHMNASRIGVTAAFCRGMPNFPCTPPVPPIDDEVVIYHAMPHGLCDGLRRRARPGLYVDITAALADKRRMLACHRSQKEWLDKSQGLNAYLDDMEAVSRRVGEMSGRFAYAEGWRRHLHLGFSARDQDPLREALGHQALLDDRYEAALQES